MEKPTIESLTKIWNKATPEERNVMVAKALGCNVQREGYAGVVWFHCGCEDKKHDISPGIGLLPYSTDLNHAAQAMVDVGMYNDTSIEVHIVCSRSLSKKLQYSVYNNYHEPQYEPPVYDEMGWFDTEVNARAFTAWAFTKLEKGKE